MNTFTRILIGVCILISVLVGSTSVSAYGYYSSYSPYAYGYGYSGYGYSPYSYGYGGPYIKPHSFWGSYVDPNYYYAALDYSSRNSLMYAQQDNLYATYNFISYNI